MQASSVAITTTTSTRRSIATAARHNHARAVYYTRCTCAHITIFHGNAAVGVKNLCRFLSVQVGVRIPLKKCFCFSDNQH